MRELGGDYRDLAGEMGYSMDEIFYFKTLQNPTNAVLTSCSAISIEYLINKLEAIGRSDAALLFEEWIAHNCKCARCNNSQTVSVRTYTLQFQTHAPLYIKYYVEI